MPVTYTEILRTDCLGDSRAKINNNFNNFKNGVIALRTGVTGGTWSVNLGTMMPLSGSHCIGDSLLTINQNIFLLKDSLQEIKTQAGSLLSSCPIEFAEITQIDSNECIGDSRSKLNYIFDFLSSIENCFNSNLPPVPLTPTPTPTSSSGLTPTPTPTSSSGLPPAPLSGIVAFVNADPIVFFGSGDDLITFP